MVKCDGQMVISRVTTIEEVKGKNRDLFINGCSFAQGTHQVFFLFRRGNSASVLAEFA